MTDMQIKKKFNVFPFSYWEIYIIFFGKLKFKNKIDGVNECQDIIKINIYIYIFSPIFLCCMNCDQFRDGLIDHLKRD
jgi:hypothetical protein